MQSKRRRTGIHRSWWLGALAAAGVAFAHGDVAPKHGGVVKEVDDVTYELVVKPGSAEIFIDDHGAAVPTAKMRGKLVVLSGAGKAEAVLKPAGGNRLAAANVTIGAGAKVVASITPGEGKAPVSVRFAVK